MLPEAQCTWVGYCGHLADPAGRLTNVERYAYPDGTGGKVAVILNSHTSHQDSHFLLTVRDHGRGITSEHLPHVFEPFFTTGQSWGIWLRYGHGV